MVEAGVLLAALGVGVILLLIPVSVRLLKGALAAEEDEADAEQVTERVETVGQSRPPEQGAGT